MNKYKNALNLLDKFFNEHSKEEIEAIFNEIDQLQIEGPTYEEYLESIQSNLEFELEPINTYESWNSLLIDPENMIAGNTQRQSITIPEKQEFIFEGTSVMDVYGGEYNYVLAA